MSFKNNLEINYGFSQGLSGLSAAAKALDVVGNNIANSQTVGFKAGSVSFADIFAGSTGMGVQVAGVSQNFGDGALMNGASALDMGISGRGFSAWLTKRVAFSTAATASLSRMKTVLSLIKPTDYF